MTGKLPRPSTEEERRELKAATRRAMSLTKASAFALITRVEAAVLSKYAATHEESAFMPIDVLLDLERDIGAPLILETLAAMQGYKLVPADPEEGGKVGYGDIAAIAKESGDVVTALAEGLKDGTLDPLERRNLGQQISENITVLHQLGRKVAGGAA